MGMKNELRAFAKSAGASLVGVADLDLLRAGLPVLPQDLLDPYRVAVSLAVRLDDAVLDSITDRPTPAYSQLCRGTNAVLDRISAEVVQWIQERGFQANAVPASFWADTVALLGNISHKAVARMAGIGWQGKSLLLVNKDFGPRLRLTTVLTDMPLEPDSPVKNLCGGCTACTDACPASAIKNVSTDSHFGSREEAVHLDRCYRKLLEFREMSGIGYTFCGVCVSVCPFGNKAVRRKKAVGAER